MSQLETLLEAICSTPSCVHFRALQGRLDWPYPKIREVMLTLHRRGWAEALRPYCWRATPAGRAAYNAVVAHAEPPPPAVPTLHIRKNPTGFYARLWKAMRAQRKFEIDDLVLVAAREGDNLRGCHVQAGRFLNALQATGYLVRLDQDPRRNAKRRYLLLPDRDTGPKVPAIGRSHVIDRNTGAIHPIARRTV